MPLVNTGVDRKYLSLYPPQTRQRVIPLTMQRLLTPASIHVYENDTFTRSTWRGTRNLHQHSDAIYALAYAKSETDKPYYLFSIQADKIERLDNVKDRRDELEDDISAEVLGKIMIASTVYRLTFDGRCGKEIEILPPNILSNRKRTDISMYIVCVFCVTTKVINLKHHRFAHQIAIGWQRPQIGE